MKGRYKHKNIKSQILSQGTWEIKITSLKWIDSMN